MSRSARSLARTAPIAALLVLAACGVEATTPQAISSGSGVGIPTTTTVPCSPEDSGGGTGGAVGSSDPACVDTDAPKPPKTTTSSTSTTTTEPGPDEQAYIDAMERALDGDQSLGLSSDGDEAACAAPRWIDALQAERLADAGLEPSDLVRSDLSEEFQRIIDLDEATEMVSALTDCGVDLKTTLAGAMADGALLDSDQRACFIGKLPDGFIENLLAVSLADGRQALDADPAFSDPITDAASACR